MSSVIRKWSRDERDKRRVSYDKLDGIIQEQLLAGPEKQMAKLPEPEGWDQTDSVLMKCQGYWWLHSNSDKRWRREGSGEVGGKTLCKEARKAFFELKSALGNPPFDFIYRFEPRDLKKFRLAEDATLPDPLNPSACRFGVI